MFGRKERIKEHLEEKFFGAYTSKTKDWELFYTIEKLEYSQAREIEFHIKRMKSKKFIRDLKSYPGITERLIRQYQKME